MFDEIDIIEAHKFSIHHREQIEQSEKCGCFYCTAIFDPKEINFWIDSNDTAICPYCAIDSVIGDQSGYPITKEFLSAMNKKWF